MNGAHRKTENAMNKNQAQYKSISLYWKDTLGNFHIYCNENEKQIIILMK